MVSVLSSALPPLCLSLWQLLALDLGSKSSSLSPRPQMQVLKLLSVGTTPDLTVQTGEWR